MKLLAQPAIGLRFVDGVEVLALNVLDERHLEERTLVPGVNLVDHDRDPQRGRLSAPPAIAARPR